MDLRNMMVFAALYIGLFMLLRNILGVPKDIDNLLRIRLHDEV